MKNTQKSSHFVSFRLLFHLYVLHRIVVRKSESNHLVDWKFGYTGKINEAVHFKIPKDLKSTQKLHPLSASSLIWGDFVFFQPRQ